MAEKSKHAFGGSENVQSALDAGLIDSYDILFLDGDTNPKIGWIDKNGVFRQVKNETDLSGVEAELANKADASEVEAMQTEIATKVDAATVQTMINDAAVGAIEVVEF